jgi:hypothetical protein
MSARIVRPATAFSKDKPARETRGRRQLKLDAHRKWVGSLPSLVTGRRGDVEVAHVSMADPSAGKTSRGKGKKADDIYVVPLSAELHREQHSIGERAFARKYGIDLVKIALALCVHSQDDEAADMIIKETVREQ